MSRKPAAKKKDEGNALYGRIREILESARARVTRSVNTTQVVANWLIGREIVEEEQKGRRRAGYGENLLARLSEWMTRDYGGGYSIPNLRFIRQFYLTYPVLLTGPEIRYALRSESGKGTTLPDSGIRYAPRSESPTHCTEAGCDKSDAVPRKSHAVRGESTAAGEEPRQERPDAAGD